MSLGKVYSALVSERGVAIERALPYLTHQRCKLDIYRPMRANAKGPIVLFFYGGGWVSGDRGSYRFVGAALAGNGITTVIPDYRLFPEVAFPQFVEDGAAAFAWVRDNLADGSQQVVLVGHSAGAHIAAMLALNSEYLGGQRPAGLVGLAGPYAFDPTTWSTTKHIFAKAASNPNQARPIVFVNAESPPSLLLHGASDTIVKLGNSIQLSERLRGYSRPVQMELFTGIGHVGLILTLSRPMRWRAAALRSIVDFVGQL